VAWQHWNPSHRAVDAIIGGVTHWAVTVNLGGTFTPPAIQEGMLAWATQALAAVPAIVFA
jgi:hypothetical protein